MATKNTGNGIRKTRKASSIPTPVTPASLPVNTVKKSVRTATMEDLIRQRAYEIYLQRGARPGGALEDWKVAEQEVLGHQSHA